MTGPTATRDLASLSTVAAVVVAAGRGLRAGGDKPKQYRDVAGKAVLRRTLEALLACDEIGSLTVVIHPDDRNLYDGAVGSLSDNPRLRAPVAGGATRQASVLAGLRSLSETAPDIVLVHDAARPFVPLQVVTASIDVIRQGAVAAVATVAVADTLKRVRDGAVVATVDRTALHAAQTPQAFAFQAILEAHEAAAMAGIDMLTDDAGVAQWAGLEVRTTPGDPANVKITSSEDLMQAERKLAPATDRGQMETRVATAYDVHAFEPGTQVMLGGIAIPHDRGLKGHSDADVVLHALTDAILATICDGDIGSHFPPSDPQWRGASSDRFLAFAVERLASRGGRIVHLDATVVCEAPKIGPHREAMRASIARICRTTPDRVSVKATTSERLGFTGRGEGIAALATATVARPVDEMEA
jgi:2-C-methyl-D-erythritol 4-phosphate cytidylyltransferase/2-C-methyl-D-erythritol 2,4-cyclodiphosphate synthase